MLKLKNNVLAIVMCFYTKDQVEQNNEKFLC